MDHIHLKKIISPPPSSPASRTFFILVSPRKKACASSKPTQIFPLSNFNRESFQGEKCDLVKDRFEVAARVFEIGEGPSTWLFIIYERVRIVEKLKNKKTHTKPVFIRAPAIIRGPYLNSWLEEGAAKELKFAGSVILVEYWPSVT